MTREFDFYIVPTPIGNLQDITLRAIDVLKKVDIIACEDTRTTQRLLNHYQITTKCISYHKYNEKERVNLILQELRNGKKIALVSDAGTPLICDPGAIIIPEILKNKYTVTSLPGACALTTFLSQVPRTDEEFAFVGFMPRNEERIKQIITKYSAQNIVFYDSPERIIKTLKVVNKYRKNAQIALGRELSKLFEEVVISDTKQMIEHFQDGVKGEIVCLIYAEPLSKDSGMTDKISILKSKGFKSKDISVILSSLYEFNKNEIYKAALTIEKASE